MASHKKIDVVCVIAAALALLICIAFMFPSALGISPAEKLIGYENRIFDSGKVHTIDIVMDDWDSFIASAQSEEYSACTLVIDGEKFSDVAIRGKGNTSLSSVASMDSERYSFKVEFDHYDSAKSYHGLDKLSLNNIIQDTTYMKDYLTYTLMRSFGVAAPLCSYVQVSVNGSEWGLYLAVEGVEDSFLSRNYGSAQGQLYKPDSMDIGGGRGKGQDFNMDDFLSGDTAPGSFTRPENGAQPGRGGMGSDDVLLRYIDDSPESYSNIFDNAKTEPTDADKARLIAALKTLSVSDEPESALDTEAVLRYFVVHNYVVNGDSYTGNMVHNYYLREFEGRLSMIPWDYNLAFGSFQGANASVSVNDPIDTPLSVGSDSRPMIDWIFADSEFTARYHELFSEFVSSVDAAAIIDETAAMIAPYVESDPSAFYSYDEFLSGLAALREFCLLRSESVSAQLEGSVPSTDSGQAQEGAKLVDTGSLDLSLTGGMGGMGGRPNEAGEKIPSDFGGAAPERGEFGHEVPSPPQMPDGGTRPFGNAAPSMPFEGMGQNMPTPEDTGTAPQEFVGQNFRPTDGGMTQSNQPGNMAVLPLVISLVLLMVGLAIALKFKR